MSTPFERRTAALAFAVALGSAAFAAQAHDVSASEAQSITPGMTRSQVQQMLGKPVAEHRYALGNGSTWSYEMQGRAIADETFDVDFAPDGTVKAAGEHMVIVDGD